jgi:tRNA(Ile)-lysidine synthase
LPSKLLNLVEKLVASWPPSTWQDVHVAVALSGGADSVALLRALLEAKQEHGGKGDIFALHVNHHLRGAESDGDERWCGELCNKLEIPWQALQGDVAARAATEGDGIEAAARQERYALLTKTAEARGARYLATAHTRDDQVETVLFRLLRGTGLRGLTGIAATRPLTPSLAVVRPLLNCTRGEVLAYLTMLGQDFRTDSSNADRSYTRNQIRGELLPLLRIQYNSNVDDAILRLAEQAREMSDFCENAARELLNSATTTNSQNEVAFHVAILREQPEILIREALRIAWREAHFPEQAMTHDWWCQLAGLATGAASNEVLNLPGNVRALVSDGLLRIQRAS